MWEIKLQKYSDVFLSCQKQLECPKAGSLIDWEIDQLSRQKMNVKRKLIWRDFGPVRGRVYELSKVIKAD